MATGRDRQPTGRLLSVAEAAAALGVTPDAVRARLHRGTLAGEKVGGTWRVRVDGDPGTDRTPTGQPAVDRQDTDRTPTAPAVDPAYVAHLEREIAYLREQLAESIATNRRHAEGDAGRGIAAGASVLEVAAGNVQPSTGANLGPDEPRSPWWRRLLGK